jgi:hypothetical protein
MRKRRGVKKRKRNKTMHKKIKKNKEHDRDNEKESKK